MRRLSITRCAGVTHVEMLAVVGIVSALAMIAVPSVDPVNAFASEAMAREASHAVRFAQRESVRTGFYHTVEFDAVTQVIRLYRLRMPGSIAEDTAAGARVLHPVDKREYRLLLSSSSGKGAHLAEVLFTFDGAPSTDAVSFDPTGAPVRVMGTGGKDAKPLKSGVVRIGRGGYERVVQVAPVTGRASLEPAAQ